MKYKTFTDYLNSLRPEKKQKFGSKDFKSKGEWVFERSSGYSGYRCKKCATWIYHNDLKICDCDKS